MKWLDASLFESWRELLEAASAYAQLTGGRFLPEDFDDARGTRSRSGAAFEAARSSCAPFVATYRVLARAAADGGETQLISDYDAATIRTVDHAAVRTMVATLESLDRYPAGGGGGDADGPASPPSPEWIAANTLEALAARLGRNARRCAEPKNAAALRAASFVADFGAAAGLPRPATPRVDATLEAFSEKIDGAPGARDALRAALAPYGELLRVAKRRDAAGARAWARCHPEEALLAGAAVAGGVFALGAGLFFAAGARRRRSK